MKEIVSNENQFKQYLLNNRLFLLFVFFSICICSLLRIFTLGFNIYIKAFITDLLFILFIGSFRYLIKPKNRFNYYMFWLLFITALSIGNTIYYQFYQSYISINLLSTASMIAEVNDSLWNKIHLIQFIYLIFPIAFIFIKFKLKKSGYIQDIDSLDNNFFYLKRIVIVTSSLVFFLLCSISINDLNIFNNQFNRGYILKKHGLYLYTINDLIQSVDFNYKDSYDSALYNYRKYYSCKWENKKEENEYTNIFKGKNVIFIHAESIQNFLVDLRINGKEVTPNLNKFIKEGMYFNKFYPQISVGTSSDTEFTLLTGLMPSSRGTVFVNYYDRLYYSMPKYFNDLGYYTFSMHGNDRNYWNRALMHESLGYQKFYGSESYILPQSIESSDHVLLGISDISFFNQSINKLQKIKDNNIPFMGSIITLSNHSPFNDISKYGEFDITSEYKYKNKYGDTEVIKRDYLEGTTIGNYIKSSHYADKAFGEFINNLKKTNILDNTIIVFYGDHEARIPKKEFNLFYNYDPVNDSILDKDNPSYIDMDNYNYDLLKNTPFVIWSNEIDLSKTINETMGMYDVLPTIANMFGFDEKYSLGHDIFSDDENIVVFPNGNVLTDNVYYSDLYEEYIILNKNPIKDDYINKISKYANTILEVSNGIVTFDLIEKEKENVGICENK